MSEYKELGHEARQDVSVRSGCHYILPGMFGGIITEDWKLRNKLSVF